VGRGGREWKGGEGETEEGRRERGRGGERSWNRVADWLRPALMTGNLCADRLLRLPRSLIAPLKSEIASLFGPL